MVIIHYRRVDRQPVRQPFHSTNPLGKEVGLQSEVPGKRRRSHHECAWERTQIGTWGRGMKFLQHRVRQTEREKSEEEVSADFEAGLVEKGANSRHDRRRREG